MIHLSHPDYEHKILMDDGNTTLLVIENPQTYRKYVHELLLGMKNEGTFSLSDGLKTYKLKDHVDIILSPFSISFSNTRISSSLQSRMKTHMASEEHYEGTMELVSSIEKYVSILTSDFITPTTWEEIEIPGLLKLFGLSVQTEYTSDSEMLLEYMNIMHDLCNVESFVFTSSLGYFSPEEIDSLVSDCQGNKHNILFIEPCHPGHVPINTKCFTIDHDNCEIF